VASQLRVVIAEAEREDFTMDSVLAETDLTQCRLPLHDLPRVLTGRSFDLLAGIKVVDLTTSVAGPYATMLLSDFGAEIIKVERPEGDDARKWGPPFLDGQALWFTALNRNKKGVVIDAGTAEGRAELLRLIRSADVFVTNQPLDVQRKLKLDYDALSRESGGLIFVSISGFGLSGERAELTCYDLIAEGYSGIMDITGEESGPPQKIGAPAADMLAGQDAAMATIAALFDRQRTGRGRKIEVSLVESMTRFLTCRIASYLGSGEVPRRSGGTDSVIAIYQSFETADWPINLGLGSDAIWKRFWRAVGDSDFGARSEFATNVDRCRLRSTIVERIQRILLTKSRLDWLELLAASRVPAGPINRVDEVVADRALWERRMLFSLSDGMGRLVPQIGLGIHIDDQPSLPRSAPPYLGEHTAEVLQTPHLPD
jgi:crotonobetainyl-CoA:carnitine CoA-transferase CaiB-like acyl-CoA transferase